MSAQATAADAAHRAAATGEDAEVVRQYAEALIGAATADGSADRAVEELEAIDREVLAAHPAFARTLSSGRVPAAEKDRILRELFEGHVGAVVSRFLRVLNRHGRLGLLSPIAAEARRIWDKRHRRVPVFVRTAVPLDDGRREALARRLAEMTGATPIMNVTTDPSLIGGLVVQVGDQVVDASVRNRLEQLRQRLIEGKTHEIQSRRDQFSYPA
ncbi:ATP synthase subunit delta [Aquisphaera giovannonii]|uniref:ATP synthase subunit delta n=1 Tax=Aquisphaera giovannonii TaxID=406548 RepID=A0A5B9W1E0_9BACT|nr:ATP synthase F1 subunit delta [Aquisphaera giovannonii]QEH34077.1 ATP synthase subunit delta [Aquisphaera giovannonii]